MTIKKINAQRVFTGIFVLSFFTISLLAFNTAKQQQQKTLSILVSKRNFCYYYEDSLKQDASNFKLGSERSITEFCELLKKENGEGNVFFIIKVQMPESLDAAAKSLVDYIKKQKNNSSSPIVPVETELIRITEQYMGFK